jgi:hypothetical protein
MSFAESRQREGTMGFVSRAAATVLVVGGMPLSHRFGHDLTGLVAPQADC